MGADMKYESFKLKHSRAMFWMCSDIGIFMWAKRFSHEHISAWKH